MRSCQNNELIYDFTFLHKQLPFLHVNKKTIAATGFDSSVIAGLVHSMSQHQPLTYHHSLNVARLAALLAWKLCLSSGEIYHICMGALLHDIGKLYIPRSIIEKESQLSDDEWVIIKKHPKNGGKIISVYPWGKPLEPMIVLHHERLDGQGYYSYSKEKLPLSVRIITLADAFDAMTSPRPYHQPPKTMNDCWLEIDSCSGSQFDPILLPYFYSVTVNNHSPDAIIKI